MKSVAYYICFFLVVLGLEAKLNAQCSIVLPKKIKSLTPTEAIINISGSTNDDLAGDQEVCAVFLEFEHTQISGVVFELESPSGQSIILTGPSTQVGKTSGTKWKIGFVRNADIANPLPAFLTATGSAKWSNSYDWGTLGDFASIVHTYYPYQGSLETFNSGSINGDWRIKILDNGSFDSGTLKDATIQFCDPAGIACQSCEPDAGSFDYTKFPVCLGTDKDLDLGLDFDSPFDADNYSFYYLLRQDDNILDFRQVLNLKNLPIGVYQVCGLSIAKNDEIKLPNYKTLTYPNFVLELNNGTLGICAALNEKCVDIEVTNGDLEIDIERAFCTGTSYAIGDSTFTMAGNYKVEIAGVNCDTIYNLTLIETDIKAIITAKDKILSCKDPGILLKSENSTVTSNAIYKWSRKFGGIVGDVTQPSLLVNEPGTYTLEIVDGNCMDEATFSVFGNAQAPDISIKTPIPVITCKDKVVSPELVSNLVLDSVHWSGLNGYFSKDLIPKINKPGTYFAKAFSTTGCESNISFEIKIDTLKPKTTLVAQPLTCSNNPTYVLNYTLNSNAFEWTGPDNFISTLKNPKVSLPGIYTLKLTNVAGCVDSFQLTVTGNPDSLDYSLSAGEILCQNQEIDLSYTSKQSGSKVTWTFPDGVTTKTGANVKANQAGKYYVDIVLKKCVFRDSIEVEEDLSKSPEVQLTKLHDIDCTYATGKLKLDTLQKGSIINSVTWKSKQTGFNSKDYEIEVDQPDIYTVTVKSDACTIILRDTIFKSTSIPEVKDFIQPKTCVKPAGIVTTTDQILTYNWTIAGDGTTIDSDSLLESINPGSYELVVTDATGCTNKYEFVVPADDTANKFAANASEIINCTSDSSILSLKFKHVKNLKWFDSNKMFISDTSRLTTKGIGWYYVEAIDTTNGCPGRDSIQVVEDFRVPNLVIDGVQDFPNCEDETIINFVSTGTDTDITYKWTGPNGFTATEQSPKVNEGGLYTLVATLGSTCDTTIQIKLNKPDVVPVVSAKASNQITCATPKTTLTGTVKNDPNISFVWKAPNNKTYNDPVIIVDVPGTYTFLAWSTTDCRDSMDVVITATGDYPEFLAAGDTLFCQDDPPFIGINKITPNLDYSWTGPKGFTSAAATNMVIDSGMYIVEGKDPNGCITKDTAFIVFDNQAPQVTLTNEIDTLDCDTDKIKIVVDSDKAIRVHDWKSTDFTSNLKDIFVDKPGIYTYIGTSKNRCSDTLDVEVFQNLKEPVFTLKADTITCAKTDVEVVVHCNDPLASYNWSGPNIVSTKDTIVTDTNGVYMIIVTGGNACTKEESIKVLIDTLSPVIIAKDDSLDCLKEKIELIASSPDDKVVFDWKGPLNFDTLGPVAFTNVAGVYTIHAVGRNGCESTKEIKLVDHIIYPSFETEVTNVISCNDPVATIRAIGSEDEKSVLWSGPNGFSSSDPEEKITKTQAGTYYFEITSITNCVEYDTLVVEVDTLAPIVQINQKGKILCEVDNAELNGEGSSTGSEFKYQWSTKDGKLYSGYLSLYPELSGAGTYLLTIKNKDNGCIDSLSYKLEEEESTLESIDWAYKKQSCPELVDGELTVNNVQGGYAPYRYLFSGFPFDETGKFSGIEAGQYTLTVKDSFGCVLDTLVTLEPTDTLQVNLGPDLDIDLGDKATVEAILNVLAETIDSVSWAPTSLIDCEDCLEAETLPMKNTLVGIFVRDENGCIASDEMVIRVDDKERIYIPNIFTPDGDGVNDSWSLSVSKNVEFVKDLRIYDRWGSMVFSDKEFIPGAGKAWDGNLNGAPVNQAVYTYIANVRMINGDPRVLKGTITIVR